VLNWFESEVGLSLVVFFGEKSYDGHLHELLEKIEVDLAVNWVCEECQNGGEVQKARNSRIIFFNGANAVELVRNLAPVHSKDPKSLEQHVVQEPKGFSS
jgi:hypothetical protein